jgi:hypothetical protein
VATAIIVTILTGCASSPPPVSLPHRQPGELFPQADSPPAECPGQYSYTVDIPDGSGRFFVYCFGKQIEL